MQTEQEGKKKKKKQTNKKWKNEDLTPSCPPYCHLAEGFFNFLCSDSPVWWWYQLCHTWRWLYFTAEYLSLLWIHNPCYLQGEFLIWMCLFSQNKAWEAPTEALRSWARLSNQGTRLGMSGLLWKCQDYFTGCYRKTGHLWRAIFILNGLILILRDFSPPKAYNAPKPSLCTFIKCLKLGYVCS